MKRLLSIALLCLYLISYTEFHQLLKLPMLVEHYIQHKHLVNDITLFQFLALHYNSETAHDSDDMKLPFKDFAHCGAIQSTVIPSLKIELKADLPSDYISSYPNFYKKFILSSHLAEIWQPPRI